MRAVPTRVLLTIGAVACLALTALVASLAWYPVRWSTDELLMAGLLAGLATVARFWPVQFTPGTRVAADSAPLFAAVLLLPVPLAGMVGLMAMLVTNAGQRLPWYRTTYNTAQVTLAVLAGATSFACFAASGQLDRLRPGLWMLGAPCAAAAMYLANWLLVELVVGVHTQRSPIHGFWRRRRLDLPYQAALYPLGLLVAAIGVENPWALTLLAVPSVVVLRAMREGMALRIQTRIALEKLADIVDMRDHYTFEHSKRVSVLARLTAQELGLPGQEVDVIELAARLHDVGKIGIKSSVLLKPGRLLDHEWLEMRTHPEVGAVLMAEFPEFAKGREMVLAHHERFDGSGYPRGLARDRIPLGARIIAVADTWDAMTSNRAYRRALDQNRAYTELARASGTQLDPVVLDAFLRVLAKRPDLAATHTQTVQDVDVPVMQPAVA
jgi:HD-GYP domain-containing protein (c-di-GMP phosphodiesterase class II)